MRGTRHNPTSKTRKMVREMAGAGKTTGEIARALVIGERTVARHYREELGAMARGRPGPKGLGVPVRDPEKGKEVAELAALQMTNDDICRIAGLTEHSLRHYYGGDLEIGRAKGREKVIDTLFAMATNGKNVAATIFWLKVHCGWNERQEITGPSGGPIQVEASRRIDVDKLSKEELLMLRSIVARGEIGSALPDDRGDRRGAAKD